MKFSIILLSVVVIKASVVDTYIPKNAIKYLPMLKKEINKEIPNFKLPVYFPALIEHESCVSLKSKRCWNPKSELKTKREQGVGLGQITRAWKRGRIRFDKLREMKMKYPKLLKGVTWLNIKKKPREQMILIILVWRDNFKRLPKKYNFYSKVAFADAAYNGGYRGMYRDRRRCGLKKGCDPSKWFNNVERYCTKSRRKLYGNRSACDINRHHVRDVFRRIPKYKKYIHTDEKVIEVIKGLNF